MAGVASWLVGFDPNPVASTVKRPGFGKTFKQALKQIGITAAGAAASAAIPLLGGVAARGDVAQTTLREERQAAGLGDITGLAGGSVFQPITIVLVAGGLAVVTAVVVGSLMRKRS